MGPVILLTALFRTPSGRVGLGKVSEFPGEPLTKVKIEEYRYPQEEPCAKKVSEKSPRTFLWRLKGEDTNIWAAHACLDPSLVSKSFLLFTHRFQRGCDL